MVATVRECNNCLRKRKLRHCPSLLNGSPLILVHHPIILRYSNAGTSPFILFSFKDADCTQYTLLTDARNVNSPCCGTCDDQLVLGWYRIGGAAGTTLATYCVPSSNCGTSATGWLNGVHPASGEGMVTRTVCYNWSDNCCSWSNTIRVLNCMDYYLYELAPSPACYLK